MTDLPPQPVRVSAVLSSVRAADAGEAVRRAVADAKARLDLPAAFAILALTADLCAQKDALEKALAEALEGVAHVGTSSAQVEHETEFYEEGTLALLLVGGHAPARPFLFVAPEQEERVGEVDLPDLADAIADLDGPVATVVAFADPRGSHVPVLPRMVDRMSPGAALVGGGSTGGAELVQICQARALTGVSVGLVLGVPAGPLGVFVAQGAALVGKRGLVTKGENGLLLEVDGQPATDLLQSLKDAEFTAKADEVAPLLSLAIAPGGLEAMERGDYFVRNLTGVDPERKAIAAAARLENGWAVSLALREGIAARQAVSANARQLADALGASPACGLYFDCASRGNQLYGMDGVDQAQLRKALGRFPLLSVKCSFELGPVRVGERSRSELHLYSGVLWVLAGGPAVAAGAV